MKTGLEQPLWIGNVAVAAIVETRIACHEWPGSLAVQSRKRPLAVLVHRAGVTRAYDVEGREISPEAFDGLFPDQRSSFEQWLRPDGEREDEFTRPARSSGSRTP